MVGPLEPNRIHTLPVQVSYHLPSSTQIFTTLLPSLQQVYVYPAAPTSTAGEKHESEVESWGSIYLKTVVQGVIMSSPEHHPSGDNPDLSLYTFDPRETFLRRSRTMVPPHLRSASPLPSSPDLGSLSHAGQTQGGQEVWTGKGLVSKALEEPGVGKNLITGRLVRRREFSWMSATEEDPLMALMQSGGDEEGSWGIEVSLGLTNGAGGLGLVKPVQAQTGFAISRASSPLAQPYASTSTTPLLPLPPMPARHSYPAVPQQARRPVPASARTTSYLPPSTTPARPVAPTRKTTTTVTKKKPTPNPRQLASVDTNSRRPSSSSSQPPPPSTAAARGLPFEIPRHVYDNPDLLTKDQAERLIASPFFLDKLSEMTGHPLVPKVKREREDDTAQGTSTKKARNGKGEDGETTMCYNCGRVKSYVWRQMTLDDSTQVTLCNACGIYRNRHGVMRPPSMWEGVDDEVKTLRLGSNKPMPSSEIDIPLAAQRLDSGFKRTMSAVVEKDAKRIAGMKQPPAAIRKSSNMAMTSPPRGSKSAVKAVRHSHSQQPIAYQQPAASSPGPFTNTRQQSHSRTPAQASSNSLQQAFVFNPDDSPNTTLNKIIGASMPMQSLDMPLSDDGGDQQGQRNMPWHHENFFHGNANAHAKMHMTPANSNTHTEERFEMSAGPHGATALKSPSPPPTFHRTSSTASKRRFHTHGSGSAGDEDDVLSQLFNRTSSIGPLGSSPAPFDFSALPPSSPPASNGPSSDIDLELGHSAMLLSSPDIPSPAPPTIQAQTQEMEKEKEKEKYRTRITPEKKMTKTTLNQSFTPSDLPSLKEEPPSYDDEIEQLWSKLQSQYELQAGMESSGQIAEGLMDSTQSQSQQDDFLALFNSLTNAQ